MGFAALQIPMMTNQKLPTGGTAIPAPALICVVDDDAAVRQALANLLASADYTPLCFASAEACLACGRLHDMAFAVVDVRLGGMGGFELQERFSAMQLDLPLVRWSGAAPRNDARRAPCRSGPRRRRRSRRRRGPRGGAPAAGCRQRRAGRLHVCAAVPGRRAGHLARARPWPHRRARDPDRHRSFRAARRRGGALPEQRICAARAAVARVGAGPAGHRLAPRRHGPGVPRRWRPAVVAAGLSRRRGGFSGAGDRHLRGRGRHARCRRAAPEHQARQHHGRSRGPVPPGGLRRGQPGRRVVPVRRVGHGARHARLHVARADGPRAVAGRCTQRPVFAGRDPVRAAHRAPAVLGGAAGQCQRMDPCAPGLGAGAAVLGGRAGAGHARANPAQAAGEKSAGTLPGRRHAGGRLAALPARLAAGARYPGLRTGARRRARQGRPVCGRCAVCGAVPGAAQPGAAHPGAGAGPGERLAPARGAGPGRRRHGAGPGVRSRAGPGAGPGPRAGVAGRRARTGRAARARRIGSGIGQPAGAGSGAPDRTVRAQGAAADPGHRRRAVARRGHAGAARRAHRQDRPPAVHAAAHQPQRAGRGQRRIAGRRAAPARARGARRRRGAGTAGARSARRHAGRYAGRQPRRGGRAGRAGGPENRGQSLFRAAVRADHRRRGAGAARPGRRRLDLRCRRHCRAAPHRQRGRPGAGPARTPARAHPARAGRLVVPGPRGQHGLAVHLARGRPGAADRAAGGRRGGGRGNRRAVRLRVHARPAAGGGLRGAGGGRARAAACAAGPPDGGHRAGRRPRRSAVRRHGPPVAGAAPAAAGRTRPRGAGGPAGRTQGAPRLRLRFRAGLSRPGARAGRGRRRAGGAGGVPAVSRRPGTRPLPVLWRPARRLARHAAGAARGTAAPAPAGTGRLARHLVRPAALPRSRRNRRPAAGRERCRARRAGPHRGPHRGPHCSRYRSRHGGGAVAAVWPADSDHVQFLAPAVPAPVPHAAGGPGPGHERRNGHRAGVVRRDGGGALQPLRGRLPVRRDRARAGGARRLCGPCDAGAAGAVPHQRVDPAADVFAGLRPGRLRCGAGRRRHENGQPGAVPAHLHRAGARRPARHGGGGHRARAGVRRAAGIPRHGQDPAGPAAVYRAPARRRRRYGAAAGHGRRSEHAHAAVLAPGVPGRSRLPGRRQRPRARVPARGRHRGVGGAGAHPPDGIPSVQRAGAVRRGGGRRPRRPCGPRRADRCPPGAAGDMGAHQSRHLRRQTRDGAGRAVRARRRRLRCTGPVRPGDRACAGAGLRPLRRLHPRAGGAVMPAPGPCHRCQGAHARRGGGLSALGGAAPGQRTGSGAGAAALRCRRGARPGHGLHRRHGRHPRHRQRDPRSPRAVRGNPGRAAGALADDHRAGTRQRAARPVDPHERRAAAAGGGGRADRARGGSGSDQGDARCARPAAIDAAHGDAHTEAGGRGGRRGSCRGGAAGAVRRRPVPGAPCALQRDLHPDAQAIAPGGNAVPGKPRGQRRLHQRAGQGAVAAGRAGGRVAGDGRSVCGTAGRKRAAARGGKGAARKPRHDAAGRAAQSQRQLDLEPVAEDHQRHAGTGPHLQPGRYPAGHAGIGVRRCAPSRRPAARAAHSRAGCRQPPGLPHGVPDGGPGRQGAPPQLRGRAAGRHRRRRVRGHHDRHHGAARGRRFAAPGPGRTGAGGAGHHRGPADVGHRPRNQPAADVDFVQRGRQPALARTRPAAAGPGAQRPAGNRRAKPARGRHHPRPARAHLQGRAGIGAARPACDHPPHRLHLAQRAGTAGSVAAAGARGAQRLGARRRRAAAAGAAQRGGQCARRHGRRAGQGAQSHHYHGVRAWRRGGHEGGRAGIPYQAGGAGHVVARRGRRAGGGPCPVSAAPGSGRAAAPPRQPDPARARNHAAGHRRPADQADRGRPGHQRNHGQDPQAQADGQDAGALAAGPSALRRAAADRPHAQPRRHRAAHHHIGRGRVVHQRNRDAQADRLTVAAPGGNHVGPWFARLERLERVRQLVGRVGRRVQQAQVGANELLSRKLELGAAFVVDGDNPAAPVQGGQHGVLVHHGQQTAGMGQLGLERGGPLVGLAPEVVDVVVEDDAVLERLARLAGAQHNADQVVMQGVADLARHVQARVAGFHDHVQQHQRDVGRVAQRGQRFLAGIGVHEIEAPAAEAHIAEREFGHHVDIDVVIHDQHAPGRRRAGRCRRACRVRPVVVDHPVRIVNLIHAAIPKCVLGRNCAPPRPHYSSGAVLSKATWAGTLSTTFMHKKIFFKRPRKTGRASKGRRKSLILLGENYACGMGSLMKCPPLKAFSAVKWRLFTTLSTADVDIRQRGFKSAICAPGAGASGDKLCLSETARRNDWPSVRPVAILVAVVCAAGGRQLAGDRLFFPGRPCLDPDGRTRPPAAPGLRGVLRLAAGGAAGGAGAGHGAAPPPRAASQQPGAAARPGAARHPHRAGARWRRSGPVGLALAVGTAQRRPARCGHARLRAGRHRPHSRVLPPRASRRRGCRPRGADAPPAWRSRQLSGRVPHASPGGRLDLGSQLRPGGGARRCGPAGARGGHAHGHYRAQAGGSEDPPPRVLRWPDVAAQPPAAAGTAGAGAGAQRPLAAPRRRAVHRPRPFQASQRYAGARHGRPPAAIGRAAPDRRHPWRRYGGPAGRRRIRDRAGTAGRRPGSRRARGGNPGRGHRAPAGPAACARRPHRARHAQHRRHRVRRRDRDGGATAQAGRPGHGGPGRGAAPRAAARTAGTALPAHRGRGRHDVLHGSAAALEPSAARPGPARRVHRAGGTVGPDSCAGTVGAGAGVRPAGALGPVCGQRRLDGGGQCQRAPVPPARLRAGRAGGAGRARRGAGPPQAGADGKHAAGRSR
uniref:Response regulatory domain-containing protein n=1 Tax=Tanacetum cinerariifolium TaxID=118510 RepID=A0A699GFB9_TANCI|nr:hypothetical protein [Tanacetum cinerariifolium]